jgi:hypothetical protein
VLNYIEKFIFAREKVMYRKILHYIIAICCISIFGCAQNETILGNRNESISQIKNYQEALAPDFQFLGRVKGTGKAEWSYRLRGATLESESLLYGRMSNGNVEKGMIVRTYKIRGESDALVSSFFAKNEHIIDSGSIEIAGRTIPYDLLAEQDIFDRDEKKLVDSKGLIMKNCYLVKDYRVDLGRLFDKSRSQILFIDSVHAGKTGLDCMQLTENMLPAKDNKSLFSEFNQQADTYVNMLLAGKTAEKSATDKRVAKESGTEVPVSGTTELESKLSTLKKLLDNGLITQSDYEKKKAELLEKF